ncbi:hypothetical protein ACTFIZ_008373 [Dictyostelium cf. discoideum]
MNREEIKNYNDKYLKIKDSIQTLNKYDHSEETYSTVSTIIGFIRNCSKLFEKRNIEDAILLVGPTGSGKTTLTNYLELMDSDFMINENEELKLGDNSKGFEIGDGSGSTTLIPNLKITDFGNLLDLAGDTNSSVEIMDLINGLIKTNIKIKKVKILIITSQDSLGSIGAYGAALKICLNKNRKLFQNVGSNLEKCMGIVFTKTSRNKLALQNCKKSLENLLKHSVDEDSKKIIDNVILCDNTSIFAKPGECDTTYAPPNENQRELIKKMIKDLSYVSVPQNLFELSSHSEFIEYSFMVVKSKIKNHINSIFQDSLPIKIFSVEMKHFNDLLTNLNQGTKNELMEFAKSLGLVLGNSNLNQSKQLIELNEELIYLSQFINNKNSLINDWVSKSGIKPYLIKVQLKITETMSKNGFNFSKSFNSDLIQISCKTSDVTKDFEKHLELTKQMKEHTLLKDNLNSKYYNNKTLKVFDYYVEENYIECQKINEVKYKIVDKEVKSYKIVKKIIPNIKKNTRIEKKLVPYTFEDTRTITEYKQVGIPWRTGIVTGVTVPVTRQETFTYTKQIMIDVSITEEIMVHDEVETLIGETIIVKEEQPEIVEKLVDVQMVRRIPKFKDEIKKVFNESSYNNDLSQIQNKINESRNIIQSKLLSYHSSCKITDFNSINKWFRERIFRFNFTLEKHRIFHFQFKLSKQIFTSSGSGSSGSGSGNGGSGSCGCH